MITEDELIEMTNAELVELEMRCRTRQAELRAEKQRTLNWVDVIRTPKT